MSTRAASWLTWSLAAIALHVLARSVDSSGQWSTLGAVGRVLEFLPFLAFPLVGALVASRRPHNWVGWICLAVGLLWMLNLLTASYVVYGLRVAAPGSMPFPVSVYALSQWLWVPSVGLFAIYLILLFPDGRLPSRRWRLLAWFSEMVMAMLSAGLVLSPGPLDGLEGVRNPFGLQSYPWLANARDAVGQS